MKPDLYLSYVVRTENSSEYKRVCVFCHKIILQNIKRSIVMVMVPPTDDNYDFYLDNAVTSCQDCVKAQQETNEFAFAGLDAHIDDEGFYYE